MLREAGIEHEAHDPGVDDGTLDPGGASAAAWVTALAYLKARATMDRIGPGSIVLAGDTVCVLDGRIFGQPADDADARGMIRAFAGRDHDVLTGVCLLRGSERDRAMFHDAARVRLGMLSDDVIAAYVASGDWRGKAGGYNLEERAAAGWPLTVDGDPDTVVGLPVRRVLALLREAGCGPVRACDPSRETTA